MPDCHDPIRRAHEAALALIPNSPDGLLVTWALYTGRRPSELVGESWPTRVDDRDINDEERE